MLHIICKAYQRVYLSTSVGILLLHITYLCAKEITVSTLVGILLLHITVLSRTLIDEIYISRNFCVVYNPLIAIPKCPIYISRNYIVLYNIPGMLTPSSFTLVGICVLHITKKQKENLH